MATAVLEEDIGFEPLPSASDDLGFEPTQSAPATPLQKLAPMTAAVVGGELRPRTNPTLVPTTPSFSGPGSTGVAASTYGESQQERQIRGQEQAIGAVRYGVPATAALLTAPVTVPALATLGAITGGAELGSQFLEKATGSREEINPGAVAGSAVLGATPFGKPAQTLAGPAVAGLKTAVKQAFINEGTFALSKVLETAVNEGRAPTMGEISNAMTEWQNYLPAVIGFGAGGIQGALSQPAKALTTEQQIAQQGQAARGRIEAATGKPAPLTGTQQTGQQIPGEFKPTSGEVAAQQAVPENVRGAIGVTPSPAVSMTAETELSRAGDVAADRLRLGVESTGRAGEAAVESKLSTMLPGATRAPSVQDAANSAIGKVKAVAQKLKADVDLAYENARALASRAMAGNPPEYFMGHPREAGKAAGKVLDSLAVKEVTDPVTGVVTRIPSQFYDEATKLARGIMEIADSPQTLDQITGLRQSVGELMNKGTEIAPGIGRKQLSELYDALAKDEARVAGKYGPTVVKAFDNARALAKNRFDTLEANPLILRSLKDASERGSFQNSEQFMGELVAKPEALKAVKAMLPPDEFTQLRRGLFDSIRNQNPKVINGASFEDAGSLAKNFRTLPQAVRSEIAGSDKLATELQTILDDANRVQNAGSAIPISGGISEKTLNEIFIESGKISTPALRASVMKDAAEAAKNARQYFNTTTAAVKARTLNPDIEPDQFIREFVLKSNSADVVDDALKQLTPSTRSAVRKQAARVFLDSAIDNSANAKNLESLVNDKNRMDIARKILEPGDFDMVNDFITWSRARNLTASAEPIRPDNLSRFVWKNTKARFVIDSLVGSMWMQDFLAKAANGPKWLSKVTSTMTVPEATALANSVKIPLNTLVAEWTRVADESDKVRKSLPENQRAAFDESLGVPQPPK